LFVGFLAFGNPQKRGAIQRYPAANGIRLNDHEVEALLQRIKSRQMIMSEQLSRT